MAERDENELLAEGLRVFPRLPEVEPRAGFAARVALHARDAHKPFAQWLRVSLGGLAVAGAAGALLIFAVPKQQQVSDDLVLAQRLELFEDMTVMQNQQALEDLDVVEVLDKLVPEAHP